MPLRTSTARVPGTSYSFTTIDDRPIDLRDVSHAVMSLSWPAMLTAICATYLLLNALFAAVFLHVGGVTNLEPDSYAHAFFFSVQTMATIGYGAMYPTSNAAHVVVVIESLVGLVFTAIATGLIFVRFARIRGRVVFSSRVTVGYFAGGKHLSVRVGNGRSNRIFDATFRLMLIRTVRAPGEPTLYKSEELTLVRSIAPTLQRAWNLLHRIDERSPLYGLTKEALADVEAELHIAMSGTDETTLTTVHGRHMWEAQAFEFGARPADVISENGASVVLDLRRFDDITPAPDPSGLPPAS